MRKPGTQVVKRVRESALATGTEVPCNAPIPRSPKKDTCTRGHTNLVPVCYPVVSRDMRILFLVFAASVAVLLWAAWAILRAVRRHGSARGQTAVQLHIREKERGEPGIDE